METTLSVSPSVSFPFEVKLSFQPFVSFLKAQQEKNKSNAALFGLYAHILEQFENLPTADKRPLEDILGPDRLASLFQLASLAVMPMSTTGQGVAYAFGLPVPMKMFYQSAEFKRMMEQFQNLLSTLPEEICVEDKLRFLYQMVLDKCYQIRPGKNADPSFRFQRQVNGLTRYFRLIVNDTFIEPRLNHPTPALQPAWIDFANGTGPLPEPENQLPMGEFTSEGFAFFVVEDITEAETVQQLQAVFTHLHSDAEPVIYRRFETALRNLVGQTDLQISIVPFSQVNGFYVHQPEVSARSVFFRHSSTVIDGYDPATQAIIHKLIRNPAPMLFPNLIGLPGNEQQLLSKKGIRSFAFYPVVNGSEMLGVLEMASPHSTAFGDDVLETIQRVIPLVQELLRYQLHQFKQNLERLIKTKFTPLQPAVEWKFNEVAWEYLRLDNRESFNSEATQVRFPQVYPLYGAIDIRNSSNERYKAVRQDFADQLTAIQTLLGQADLPDELALPNQLMTTAYSWQNKLIAGLNPEDELGISDFLALEVNPYFQHLRLHYPQLETPVQRYFKRTNATNGQFNQALQVYERSVEWLNTAVNTFIEKEEKQLQTIYPHYFERYRTDGMEYTIYVGQSIAPQTPFEPDFLRHLYAWQLKSMVELASLTNLLLPRLPLALQTTQLILAHSQPVDISFRQDEHRFDVEGSYSIRYEVLKKRIDKAYIAGTNERLTQPNTIALVYSNRREVADYLPFITALQEQKKLTPEIEYLDLEPLQGVARLKAIRLHLNYPEPAR
ncbi:GAF domain-containing protein [Larkinella punicea]|uniref:GAF domain-containing protein n=1 Tax=Larkinella punicea TaxID=2315727 RepID=A0A368JI17_9BACT|nr:GAF domain-containing protein [Larkinella punicea]RCR67182.1 GAF domain-containing protein [Larkinella punicea]